MGQIRDLIRGRSKPVQTYWNGEPTPCRKVTVLVADSGRFPRYWARHLVGQWVPAVEVRYFAQPFYLYDDRGQGWDKVTWGQGSPRWSHDDVEVAGVRDRDV